MTQIFWPVERRSLVAMVSLTQAIEARLARDYLPDLVVRSGDLGPGRGIEIRLRLQPITRDLRRPGNNDRCVRQEDCQPRPGRRAWLKQPEKCAAAGDGERDAISHERVGNVDPGRRRKIGRDLQ